MHATRQTVFEWFKCSSLLLASASTLTMIDWDLPGQIWLCAWSNCWTISASKGCRQLSCWVNEVIGRNQILKNSIYKFWRVLWRGGDVLHPQFPTMLSFCCWVGAGDVGFFLYIFFFSSLELCCKIHCSQVSKTLTHLKTWLHVFLVVEWQKAHIHRTVYCAFAISSTCLLFEHRTIYIFIA